MKTSRQHQPTAPVKSSFAPAQPGRLHRKCACGGTPGMAGECEECRKNRLKLQRYSSQTASPSTVPSVVGEVLSSPGQPLDRTTREVMEPHFGHDFSRVRVHTDDRAAESARSVAADAYTVGPQMVFGSARYAPETSAGRHLIAHELTHVVQQTRSGAGKESSRSPERNSPGIGIAAGRGASSEGALQVSSPTDATEREAEQVAERLFPASGPANSTTARSEPAGSGNAFAQLDPARHGDLEASATTCASCGSSRKLPGGFADPGRPLPEQTRAEMEQSFGTDLSAVRVHTNSGAAQLTRGLNAQAFTYGNHIFFGQGNYDVESMSGKRLLAHELTHTVQQRDAIAMLAREGEGRTTLQCVNENLSSAGVASWLLAIVGTTCGLIFGIAGSPTGPGAAGAAAFGAAVCIAGVIGASVGAVLGVISGCWSDPNFRSRGANLR